MGINILVFSDSHGSDRGMLSVIDRYNAYDTVIHLGDGVREFSRMKSIFPNKAMYSVKGNNDWHDYSPQSMNIILGGKAFYLTHGHLEGVKQGLSTIREKARLNGAEVVLYGHTHIPKISLEGGILYINPGSIGHPYGGKPSYAVIEIEDGKVNPQIFWIGE